MGDFERAADEKGEDDEANASNPERFRFFGDDEEASPEVPVRLDNGVEGAGLVKADIGVFFPDEKILVPFAAAVAKGETEA
jgi:hypothetical protein